MATVALPNTFVANTPARATEVNANFTAITDQVNGNINSDNLAANAVTTAKLATGVVTTAKIANEAVTPEKTSVFSGMTSALKIFAGRVQSNGTATHLPAGWSCTREGTTGTYTYTITHNLGVTTYGGVVTALNNYPASFAAISSTQASIRFTNPVVSADLVADAFNFILFRYA